MRLQELVNKFKTLYGTSELQMRVFFAPGRVNLIGEHTDYNGGFVFPCAIDYGTFLIVRRTTDTNYKFATLNFDFKTDIPVGKPKYKKENKWVNYPLGIIDQYYIDGNNISGLEFLFYGNIPDSAGLSSSASIEMLTAFALNNIFKTLYSPMELVKISKSAENNFIGLNCGIMDMFAIGFGQSGQALALNCSTMEYDTIPLELGDYKIVITNSNKKRALADSKYNERVEECNKAVKWISKEKKITNLSELSLADFRTVEHLIPIPVIRRRAAHIISENYRVKESIKALNKGNLELFGKLMNASHNSLRDLYEVSGVELDCLVETSQKCNGVLGSRMTGAGFGGCTVSLVHKNSIEDFKIIVKNKYFNKFGLEAEFYETNAGDGVKEIEIHSEIEI